MRLRSANRGNANNTWNVNSSGTVNNNNASNAYRGCPDCIAGVIRPNIVRYTKGAKMIQGAEYLARKGEQHRADAAAGAAVMPAMTVRTRVYGVL